MKRYAIICCGVWISLNIFNFNCLFSSAFKHLPLLHLFNSMGRLIKSIQWSCHITCQPSHLHNLAPNSRQIWSSSSRRLRFLLSTILCCLFSLRWNLFFYIHMFAIVHPTGYTIRLSDTREHLINGVNQIHWDLGLSHVTLWSFFSLW